MDARIAIVRTGVANLASVAVACRRLGAKQVIVDSPNELKTSDALILPGVGAFGAGITRLRERGWDQILRNRFAKDQPTLAICLGMQLLCESSEEAPSETGIGILPGRIEKFPDDVMVPQFGWNYVASASDRFSSGYVYFANSYCLPNNPSICEAGWEVLIAEHGCQFVAAAAKGRWLACQFHPELSSRYGSALLRNWLQKISGRSSNQPKQKKLNKSKQSEAPEC